LQQFRVLAFYFSPNHTFNTSHQIINRGSRVKVLNLTVTVANLEESNSWSGRSFFDDVTTAVNKTHGNLNVESEIRCVPVTVILDADRHLIEFLTVCRTASWMIAFKDSPLGS